MKTHYWGKRDGYAYCGACVPPSQLTAHASSITCKRCLRHLAGLPRKPVEERKEGRRVTTVTKTHWAHLHSGAPICGELSRAAKATHEQDAVTCGRCLRLLGIKTTGERAAAERLLKSVGDSVALDSLLRRAFVHTEGELRARLEALKLVIEASYAYTHHEGYANMRTEAQALVDYLEGN